MTQAFLAGLALAVTLAAAASLVFEDCGRVRKRLLSLGADMGSARCGGGHQRGNRHQNRRGEAGLSAAAGSGPHGLRDTAMMLELVGAMLDAGSGIGRSLELVAASASAEYSSSLRPVVSALSVGADWATAWRSSKVRLPEILELRDALGFAALTGAPSSAILYAQAARLRRERFRAAEKRAASLGVKLVVPLGLCSLPAFICLGVVPVLLALVPEGS